MFISTNSGVFKNITIFVSHSFVHMIDNIPQHKRSDMAETANAIIVIRDGKLSLLEHIGEELVQTPLIQILDVGPCKEKPILQLK